jgi:hypothetical protein
MNRIAVAVIVLPLALFLGACAREEGNRVAAPEKAAGQELVREASWISDRDQVAAAAATAAAHPLVRRVLADAGAGRLAYTPQYAIRAVGRTIGDRAVAVITLPYVTAGDSTHATFISLLESDGEAAVSRAEMIWGRDPRPDEIGFEPFYAGGGRGWIREDDLRTAATVPDGSLAPERVNKQKFLTCFSTLGPQLCSQGAALSNQVAPSLPYHEAIGCAAGTAVAAVSCAAGAWEK